MVRFSALEVHQSSVWQSELSVIVPNAGHRPFLLSKRRSEEI